MKRKTVKVLTCVIKRDLQGNVVSESYRIDRWPVPIDQEPELYAELKAALEAGEHVYDIAERFEMDPCTVRFWRRQLGIEPK